jgi:hypothetical protein
MKRLIFSLVSMLIILMATATSCSQVIATSPSNSNPTPKASSWVEPSITTPSNLPTVTYFPTQKANSEGYNAALFIGTLILDNGLLLAERVETGTNPTPTVSKTRVLPIWPLGYSLSTYGNRIQVLDEKGQPQTRLGGVVRLGGSVFPENLPPQNVNQPLPSGYTGQDWDTMPTVFQNYAPFQLPEYRNLPYPNSTIEGTLEIDDYLLYLKTKDGQRYLPIWPFNYYMLSIRIYDDKGQIVGQKGDNVKLSGGIVETNTVKNYIGLPNVPNSWKEPYWLVSVQ